MILRSGRTPHGHCSTCGRYFTDIPSAPRSMSATVAARIRRGVIHANFFAASHALIPVAATAAADDAPITH